MFRFSLIFYLFKIKILLRWSKRLEINSPKSQRIVLDYYFDLNIRYLDVLSVKIDFNLKS